MLKCSLMPHMWAIENFDAATWALWSRGYAQVLPSVECVKIRFRVSHTVVFPWISKLEGDWSKLHSCRNEGVVRSTATGAADVRQAASIWCDGICPTHTGLIDRATRSCRASIAG